MSEKKAGVVTELFRAVDGLDRKALDGLQHHQEERLVLAVGAFMSPEVDPGGDILDILDIVASWPPELRAVVPLIDALPAEARRLLPDVLRGMAAHPGDCASLEAETGEPVSVRARVASWAGGLSEQGLRLMFTELVAAAWRHREQHLTATADALIVMAEGLRTSLKYDAADLGADRLADQRLAAGRMPRRQLKGTCPPVEVGQKRTHPRHGLVVVQPVEGDVAYYTAPDGALGSEWATTVATWPLAEDFEPPPRGMKGSGRMPEGVCSCQWEEGDSPCAMHGQDEGEKPSDLAGLAKREADELATLRQRLDGYAGGDRPSSPPVALLRRERELGGKSFLATMAATREEIAGSGAVDVDDWLRGLNDPGEQKPTPRVWKAGTVPLEVKPGMLLREDRLAGRWEVRHLEGEHWTLHPVDGQTNHQLYRGDKLLRREPGERWLLAEDFPVPEDFAC